MRFQFFKMKNSINFEAEFEELIDTEKCYYRLETNPLLIDAVLYQLVRYVGLEDMKNMRLVHPSWNRAVTPRLRKFCKVVFRPVGPEEDLFKSSGNRCGASFELNTANGAISEAATHDDSERIVSFTHIFSRSLEMFGDSPFSEFKLIDFPFDSPIGQDFFNVCGTRIKVLDIRVNRKGRSKLPATFGGNFYPNLLEHKVPFLRKLVLFPYPGLETAQFTQTIPFVESIHFKEWASKELLYAEPFLQTLFTKSVRLNEIWVSIGLENCKSVENILLAVASSGRYSSLITLHIAYLRLSHLEILMDLSLQKCRLRLHNFRIEALAHDVPTSMFEFFLRSQSVNMQDFYCRRFLGSSKFGKFSFPRMLGLKKLDCELSARQVMPLRCNTRFPNLQTLNLFGTCCQVFTFDKQFSGNKISESLTTLHFRPGLIVTGCILSLAEHFPFLKSLTLSIVNSNDMKQLLRCWETLEDLELYFSDGITKIDSILTGMPFARCLDMLQRLKDLHNGRRGSSTGESLLENLVDKCYSKILSEAADHSVALLFEEEEVSLRNFKNLKTLHLEYNAFLMSRSNLDAGGDAQNAVGENANNNEENNAEPFVEESYLPTDITGYFAIAQMRSLRKVSLPECSFSKECCNRLIDNLGLVSWTFCSEASDIVPPKKL